MLPSKLAGNSRARKSQHVKHSSAAAAADDVSEENVQKLRYVAFFLLNKNEMSVKVL